MDFTDKMIPVIDKALANARSKSYSVPELVSGLDELVLHCERRGYLYVKDDSDDEYGLYIRDREGFCLLWVGIWCSYWQRTRHPICIAVQVGNNGWSQESVNKFKTTYAGATEPNDGYLVYAMPFDSQRQTIATLLTEQIDKHMAAL